MCITPGALLSIHSKTSPPQLTAVCQQCRLRGLALCVTRDCVGKTVGLTLQGQAYVLSN